MSWHKTTHGMWRFAGLFDPEAANTVQTALAPLTKPQPGPDGERDPRSMGRRRADALVQVCAWAMACPEMPTHGGRRPRLVARVSLHDLTHLAGVASLNNGDVVSIPGFLERAGEVDAVLALFGHEGRLLHYGRAQRLAPADHRLDTRGIWRTVMIGGIPT